MSKVRIVQIAYMGDDGRTEYLDNQGRIWYDDGINVVDHDHSTSTDVRYKWQPKWKQVELPEEPEL